jgi:chaperonin GroES
MDLQAKLSLDTILSEKNLAEQLSAQDRTAIATAVVEEWRIDKRTRYEWEDRMKFALNLALQVLEQKSFPWPGASNVKFPLVTIAALQYQARAYPALVPGPDIVKVRTFGDDPEGVVAEQGRRIASHMSYQFLEEDEDWEADEDAALISQSIIGSAFKKTYFSSRLGHNVSEHVFAKDLYISYFAKNLASAPRITQVLYFSSNDLEERRRSGLFLEWDTEPAEAKPAVEAPETLDEARDEQQGLDRPSDDPATPFKILEQHRWLDLDGDGFNEPYVVFVREDTQTLLRVVARFRKGSVKYASDGQIYAIEADQYFTQRIFIPSPDGGIYGLGFGSLLSPLNESINSSINLLLDAGVVANTAGGLLGRGVKFRSGETTFKPWEWKRVDSTGDDLRKGVFPLPVRDPSMVVFSLLKLLIDYGERVAMATDPQVGVPVGQNTPAETSRNMIAEGQRVFSAIYKRTRRALKEEFRKVYRLNRTFLPDSQTFVGDNKESSAKIFRADYSLPDKVIVPAADPEMVPDAERLQRAMALKQASLTTPGYNRYEVEKRFLRAIRAEDIDIIFPDPKGPNAVPPIPQPKVLIEMMRLEGQKLKMKLDLQVKMAKLLQDAELNRAKITELEARAMHEAAAADGVAVGHQIAAVEALTGALKAKQEGIFSTMNMLKEMYQSLHEGQNDHQGGIPGMEGAAGHEGALSLPTGAAGAGQGGLGQAGIPG